MAPAQESLRDNGVVTVEDVWEGRTPPPAWLDVMFIQRVLSKESAVYGTFEPIVEDIEVRYATAEGDNYCSQLFRVRARVRVRGCAAPRCVLVKCLPAGDAFRRLVEAQGFFRTEAHVMGRVVPAMEALLREAALDAPNPHAPFSARCLAHGPLPDTHLVVQDLSPEGFGLADRLQGLDVDAARLSVRALARFHAMSAALLRRRPHLLAPLRCPFEAALGDEHQAEAYLKAAARAFASWGGPFARYHDKVLSLQGKIIKKVQATSGFRPGKFNVMVHGDFWVNNILFKRDAKGQACDVRFVDLQMCHVSNPAFDLLLLRHTSLSEDVFWHDWDHLLEEYAGTLAQTLELLGEQTVTLEDIKSDLEEAKHFAVPAALLWLPPVKMQGGKYDIEQALAEGGLDSQGAMYHTPLFRRWMEKLLPLFDEEELFDL